MRETVAPEDSPSAPTLAARLEAVVLRGVFVALVAVTAVVLGQDLKQRLDAPQDFASPAEPWPEVEPYLPSARPELGEPDRDAPRVSEERLREPMVLELVGGGRLEATGTITPGTAARLAAELEKRGDYVKTVVLESPGGSVQDALEMAKLIRGRTLDTLVEGGGLCASSCPLVFAGGVGRTAVPRASIGVHQVSAMRPRSAIDFADAEPSMGEAQRVSAEIQRHLLTMGVDLDVWIRAMETPPEQIYYFTDDELVKTKLATELSR
jgi:hypothetical protein